MWEKHMWSAVYATGSKTNEILWNVRRVAVGRPLAYVETKEMRVHWPCYRAFRFCRLLGTITDFMSCCSDTNAIRRGRSNLRSPCNACAQHGDYMRVATLLNMLQSTGPKFGKTHQAQGVEHLHSLSKSSITGLKIYGICGSHWIA